MILGNAAAARVRLMSEESETLCYAILRRIDEWLDTIERRGRTNMRGCLWRGMLAVAVFLPALGSAAAQDQQGQEQRRIVGVWDVSVTIVSCTTGAAVGTGAAIIMFNDGGTVMDASSNSNESARLGTWRHLGGSSYSTLSKYFTYSAFGPAAFNGTGVLTREIELNKNADEYTATSTNEVYNAAGQLINTICATSTGTRSE
jgi:hypothetical protein